jgi:hypothetical protein
MANGAYPYFHALRERSWLRTLLPALGLMALGFGLMIWTRSFEESWKAWSILQVILHETGALLVATMALSLIWEFLAKRAFTDEILARVNMARSLEDAGLVKAEQDYHETQADWDYLFQHTHHADIFFAGGHTWRTVHGERVVAFAARGGTRVRAILPDPDHQETVAELARRFGRAADHVLLSIREAVDFFSGLVKGRNSTVEVRFIQKAPLISFYVFDEFAVVVLYNHVRKGPVPAFVFKKGPLYEFFQSQFDDLLNLCIPPQSPSPAQVNS